MIQKKFIGWISLVLLVVAAVILAILVLLVFFPSLAILPNQNPQAMIVVSGVHALMAAVFGFFAFKTSPGRVGAIGGLVLFVAIAILLSFTIITTRIEGRNAQQTSPIENVGPVAESTATEMVVVPQGKLPAPSFESQTYINETVGFALDYPVGWLVQETVVGQRGTQVVFVSSPELFEATTMPEGGSRMSMTIYDWDPKNDLPAYVEKTKNSWASSGFTILEEQALTLDLGLAAVRFKVQSSDTTFPVLIAAVGEKYLFLSGEGDLVLVNEILVRLRPISQ